MRLSSHSWELIRIPGNFILNPGNTYTAHLVGCMQLTRIPRNSTNFWEFLSKSRECLPHNPPLTACSYYSFPEFITNSWELSSKSREHMSSRCVLVPLVPSIHTKSWESMHRVTSLVACWPRHSRDCYLIPGNFSHIPGNACTIPPTALSLVPSISFLDGEFPVI